MTEKLGGETPKGAFSPLVLNLLLEDESLELSDEKMLLLNI